MMNIKKWFISKKNLIEERDRAIGLRNEILKRGTANHVIEKILKRGISWYDYQSLDKQKQTEYYEDAQRILNTDVFKNENNHYTADLISEIAKASPNHETTIALRMSINGVEALRERLESIVDPKEQQPSEDDLHNPI